MALLNLNGRKHFIDVQSIEVKEVSSGRYSVTYDGDRTFEVIGGIKSGGAKNEWFVRNEVLYGDRWLPTKSFIESIKMGAMY